MMTWYKRVTWHKASQAQGADRLERTMRWFMKRRKNRRKTVFGWWRGERRVKIVGAWEYSHRTHSLGWNGFLLNLREEIGRMSRFGEKLSICAFPLIYIAFFFLSFFPFIFEKKKIKFKHFFILICY